MFGKILGAEEIMEVIPQCYPMLMLDRFTKESDTKFIGFKTLTFDEEFFQGHFPNHPIMPGVLQIEAMKQTAEIGLKEQLNPTGDKNIYIKSMKNVKFRKPNHPGDRFRVEVEVLSIENNVATVSAKLSNNAGVTCQAQLEIGVREYEQVSQKMPEFNEFDMSDDIAMDITKIMETIPHRYPFLFLDFIKTLEGDEVVAIKNTSYNEPMFQGHNSSRAVLPESVQSEILAQAGCTGILNRPENKGKIGYFMSINEAEFLKPIYPGDQLVVKLTITGAGGKFGKGQGSILVDGEVMSTCKLTFALVDA